MWGNFYEWGRKDPLPQAYIDRNGATGNVVDIYDRNGQPLVLGTDGGYRAVPVAIALGSSANTLTYATQHPLTYIFANQLWYSITITDTEFANFWGGTSGRKTVYDPCPQGWKTPPENTWYDFTGTDTGWNPNSGGSTLVGQGTFPFYAEGAMTQSVIGKVTCGRLYRDGASTTPNPRPIAWYPSGGFRYYADGGVVRIGQSGFTYASGYGGKGGGGGAYLDTGAGGSTLINKIHGADTYAFPVRCVRE